MTVRDMSAKYRLVAERGKTSKIMLRSAGKGPLPQYAAGSWGPEEGDALLARDGRSWRRL